jgi:transcriptional regulator of met regulon
MNDRTIRVMAAALALERFTVVELCDAAGLRRSQADPILNLLKKEEFLIRSQGGPQPPNTGNGADVLPERAVVPVAAHRPSRVYEVTPVQEKRQEFTDRLYRIRRLLQTSERSNTAVSDLRTVDLELTLIELLLRICDRATKFEPLQRDDLKAVERHLAEAYDHLKSVMYEMGIDLQKTEFHNHPLNQQWQRWGRCNEKLDAAIDRWIGPRAPKQLSRQFPNVNFDKLRNSRWTLYGRYARPPVHAG